MNNSFEKKPGLRRAREFPQAWKIGGTIVVCTVAPIVAAITARNFFNEVEWSSNIHKGILSNAGAFILAASVLGSIYLSRFRSEDVAGNNKQQAKKAMWRVGVVGASPFMSSFAVGRNVTNETGKHTTTPDSLASSLIDSPFPDGVVTGSTMATTGEVVCEIITPISGNGNQAIDSMKRPQASLNIAGFNAGPVDGDEGPTTRATDEAFKADDRVQMECPYNDAMCLKLYAMTCGLLTDGNLLTPAFD
jgi:hypothetical protein